MRPPPSGSTAHDQESRSPHDPDANWTRSGPQRRLFFGYKAHLGVDQGSGLIRSRVLTPAKTYESEVADALIWATRGPSMPTRPMRRRPAARPLKARGVKDRIQHRRTKYQKELPPWQTVRNKLIGRIRQAIERTFSHSKAAIASRACATEGLPRTPSTSISSSSPSTSNRSRERR